MIKREGLGVTEDVLMKSGVWAGGGGGEGGMQLLPGTERDPCLAFLSLSLSPLCVLQFEAARSSEGGGKEAQRREEGRKEEEEEQSRADSRRRRNWIGKSFAFFLAAREGQTNPLGKKADETEGAGKSPEKKILNTPSPLEPKMHHVTTFSKFVLYGLVGFGDSQEGLPLAATADLLL